MKKATISTALLVATVGCAGAQTEPADGREAIAITNVTVIPMDRPGTVPGQTVLVHDGVITEVGPAGSVLADADDRVIDGSGRFLMPGLAEMHAHVPPGADPPREAVEDILFLYVANGITTIRGMLGSEYQIPLAFVAPETTGAEPCQPRSSAPQTPTPSSSTTRVSVKAQISMR